jgi:hypothetical protein
VVMTEKFNTEILTLKCIYRKKVQRNIKERNKRLIIIIIIIIMLIISQGREPWKNIARPTKVINEVTIRENNRMQRSEYFSFLCYMHTFHNFQFFDESFILTTKYLLGSPL